MARKLGEKKRLATLAKKTAEQRLAVLEQLAKCCIVQLACERIGVGRSTYYKWHSEDAKFKELADKAIIAGRAYINDVAMTGLLKKIQEGNKVALIFWLKNNHPWFGDKIRYEHKHHVVGIGDRVLTDEQREQIVHALRVSGREESIRRHEYLSKIFLAEVDSSSPKDPSGLNDMPTPPSNQVSTPLPLPPKKGSKKGLNIKEFLKRQKRP